VIERALTFGINLFDTADTYGRGAMERKLGDRLPSDGSAHIVTKIGTDLEGQPPRKRFDIAFLQESFERCQERQKRQKLDLVLLHNPGVDTVARRDAAGWLEQQVSDGNL